MGGEKGQWEGGEGAVGRERRGSGREEKGQ